MWRENVDVYRDRQTLEQFVLSAGLFEPRGGLKVSWANDLKTLRLIRAITELAYNKYYNSKREEILKLPEDPEVKTVVYGDKIPAASFGVEENMAGIREFFETGSVFNRPAIELVRFAYHPVASAYPENERVHMLGDMFKFVHSFYHDREVALIMPPRVRDFVAKTGYPLVLEDLPERHSPSADQVRETWHEYWRPFDSAEMRPRVYKLIIKNDK